MEAVKCKKLSFTYPKTQDPALSDISFEVGEGEFVLVMGRSAGGKSTLLKLMKKEIAPAGVIEGELEVGRGVGYVAQNVEESIVCDKVRSELSFGLTNMGCNRDEAELLVCETASYFNLADKLDEDVSSLSGGEKQMLNLASVMIMKPDILVLDEPTAQLDPIWSERLLEAIKKLHNDFSTTIIMSGHSAEELFFYADSIILLDKGKMLFKGKQEDMLAFLNDNHPQLLSLLPVKMRIGNGRSVKACREELKAKELKSVYVPFESMGVAVEIKGVSFAYKKGCDVLDNLSFDIHRGCINVVVGANASGKTTLLKVIAGVKRHYRGRIRAHGKVAMLCQNPLDLFNKESCGEEAEFGELTDFLEISDIQNRHPYDLSGGQALRLGIAKVLQRGADIILLDEPTRALDAVMKKKLAQKLKTLCSQGKTVVIVTHDIEFAGEYADVVSFMSNGRIVATSDRQSFFSSLSFYSTVVSRITKGIAQGIVCLSDLEQAGGITR